MLEGAGILAAGMLAGRFWPARRKGPKPTKPAQPICGCKHHYSFHAKTGECHGTKHGAVIGRDSFGYPDDWEQVPCGCKRYTGIEPLPEYYAPEIT